MKKARFAALASGGVLACAVLAATAAAQGALDMPAALPEPQAYAALLAGLGALCALGRRRAPAQRWARLYRFMRRTPAASTGR